MGDNKTPSGMEPSPTKVFQGCDEKQLTTDKVRFERAFSGTNLSRDNHRTIDRTTPHGNSLRCLQLRELSEQFADAITPDNVS
jgi:hypothetical protein